MRLQELIIENITSLKGLHTINFEEISKQSDLFAITGPTGSGKSSLLMAISMVLYGQNHKGLNAADLVTTHSPYGKIELTFDQNGARYKCFWSCQTLKKNGEPRKTPAITRQLSVSENGSDYREIEDGSINDILGLSWEQFTKVVILNQGQFSEFLTASFKDRKEILEQLMGHGQLQVIGKILRSLLKNYEAEISSLENQGEFAKLMSEEEFEALNLRAQSIKEKLPALQELEEKQRSADRLIEELLGLNEKSLQNKSQQQQKTTAINDIQKSLQEQQNKLKEITSQYEEKLTKNKTYRPFLQEAAKNQSDTKKLEEILEIKNQSLKDAESQIEKKRNDETTTRNDLEKIKQNRTRLNKELGDFSREDINTIENLLRSYGENLQIKSNSDQLLKNWTEEKTEIEETGKRERDELLSLIQQTIPKAKDIESSMTSIKEEIKTLQIHEEQLFETEKKKHTLDESVKRFQLLEDSLKEEKEKISQSIQALNEKIELSCKEKAKIEKTRQILTERTEKWRLLQQAQEFLQGGDHDHKESDLPCPVCQTTGIAWDDLFNNLLTGTEEDFKSLEEQSLALDKIEKVLALTKRECELETISLEKKDSELKEAQIQLKVTSKEAESTHTLLNNTSREEISHKRETLQLLLEKCHSFIPRRDQQRSKWKQLEQRIQNQKDEQSQVEEKLISIVGKIKEHQFPLDLTNWKNELSLYEKKKELAHQQDILTQQTQAKEDSLNTLSEEMKSITKKKDILTKEIQTHNQELTKLSNEMAQNQYPADPTKELEQWDKLIEDLRLKKDEKEKSLREVEAKYRQIKEQINYLEEQAKEVEKLKGSYISELSTHESELSELFAQISIELLENLPLSHENYIRYLEKIILQAKLSEEIKEGDTQLNRNFQMDIMAPITDALKKINNAEKEKFAGLNSQIETYKKQQKKISELGDRIKEQKKKLERLQKLDHYIGKDRFRDFALTILENTLLDMANHEIASLADGRYELIHAKAGKRSEFKVKDQWHGGIERKVSTLSGGETFLLSLGLAMGLSDITRGQTEIDSFFIDEGFGTLDQDSIEQVLDCLMAIQSRGKQIGLISHVTNLTNQIPVKLEILKNNFGESTISLQ